MKIIQQICTSKITYVVSLLKQIEQIADVAFDDIKLQQLFDDFLVFENLEVLDFLEECTLDAMSMCVTRLLLWFNLFAHQLDSWSHLFKKMINVGL